MTRWLLRRNIQKYGINPPSVIVYLLPVLELIMAIPQNAEADRLRNLKDAQRLRKKCADLDKARALVEKKAEGEKRVEKEREMCLVAEGNAEKKVECERKRADEEKGMPLAVEGNAEKKMECERKRADEERKMCLAAEAKVDSLEREMSEMRAKLKMQEIM
jgi:hypothetical protein